MKKTKDEFRSICELKEKFFPQDKSCDRQFEDFEEMGIELSKNTLEKIKLEIAKL